MTFTTKFLNGRHRVFDTDTNRIAVRKGSSVDGDGYDTHKKAQSQADAINRNVARRKKESP